VSSGHRPQREKLKFAFIKLVKLDLRVAFVNPVPNSKFQIPTFSLILPSLYIQILDTYPKLKKRIMSFQDFQSGGIGKPSSSSAGPRSQSQSPSQAVAAGIFQINTAVAAFRRLVDSIGTAKDTPVHRQKLHTTRQRILQLVKDTSAKLKTVSDSDRDASVNPSKKLEDAKLARDFQTTLQEFQKVQQLASERESTYSPSAPPSSLSKISGSDEYSEPNLDQDSRPFALEQKR
jgi:syntaxin 7